MSRRRSRIRWAVAIVLTLAVLVVWPVPAMWQGATVTSSRLLLRPAIDLTRSADVMAAIGIPASDAVAATVFLGWKEPLRWPDSCQRRVSVTMPEGWVHEHTFVIPGQVVVPQSDPARAVVLQPGSVQRFFRPTFVRASRGAGAPGDLRASARIERVCDGVPSDTLDLVLSVTPVVVP